MHYETKHFDEYGSITIHDLRNKSNSLLNLVTEELRPLTVTMTNGKQILLFPKELLEPIYDLDFHMILLAAMRYAMGKRTFTPLTVDKYIRRHIRLLDKKNLTVAIRDIREHLEDYGEHEPSPTLWRDLMATLEARLEEDPASAERCGCSCPQCGEPLEIMSMADSWHTPGGFDVIAHCWSCDSDYEWFRDNDGNDAEIKRYFFG